MENTAVTTFEHAMQDFAEEIGKECYVFKERNTIFVSIFNSGDAMSLVSSPVIVNNKIISISWLIDDSYGVTVEEGLTNGKNLDPAQVVKDYIFDDWDSALRKVYPEYR